ncbi:Alpha/Beta hydrolase protein [Aspergillus granulosus]|uniref:Alpha/Beta hydrolase protein n=1 Tax=Aspergillus granulosus TaxID=176169 RepID=A0ABR4GVA2_9EURO
MRTWSRIRLPLSNNAVPPVFTEATRTNQTLPLCDGRILGFAEYGSPTGFPVLYFHGFPSSRLEGSGVDGNARRRGLRIISLDRPGYGLSTFKPNRRITDWPSDVKSLADHLRIPKFAVLGGSGGSPYALACAHALPHERLSAVGIFAGAAPWEAGIQHISPSRRILSWAAASSPKALGVLFSGVIGASRWAATTSPVTRWLDTWLEKQESLEKSELSTKQRREEVLAMAFEAFAQGPAATVQEASLLSHDWGLRLEDVAYNRIQIWHGEKDANVPVEMVKYMTERLPNADLCVYKGETHYTLSRHIDEIFSELVPESDIQQHQESQ